MSDVMRDWQIVTPEEWAGIAYKRSLCEPLQVSYPTLLEALKSGNLERDANNPLAFRIPKTGKPEYIAPEAEK